MPNAAFFLRRLFHSLEIQTFQDYEIVVTKETGSMAVNTNAAIKKSNGRLVKILYMDDYLSKPDSLEQMVARFNGGWLVTGCDHDNGETIGNPHIPSYNHEIHTGKNTIGSPSVLMFENDKPLLFDEFLSWTLDCDYYKRLYERYGPPTILEEPLVTLGIGTHQTTHRLTQDQKDREVYYTIAKHRKTQT